VAGGIGLRIFLLTHNCTGGGAKSVKLLHNQLKKYDHDIKPVLVNFQQKNIFSKLYTNYKLLPYLEKLVKNMRPDDILHVYNMYLFPVVGYLTKKHNINSVATLNGITFSISMSNYNNLPCFIHPKFYRNLFLMRYIKEIRFFTTLCPFYRDSWARDGIDRRRITIIPNMIDPCFKPVKKIQHSRFVITFVGNNIGAGWRRLDILLSILKYFDSKDIMVIVAGKGWEKLIKNYKDERIKYFGFVSDSLLHKIYAQTDVMVLPYDYPTPISRVIVEAMQYGIPVVTTGNLYFSPIVRNGVDGMLLYPMTSDKLYHVLRFLIDNPEVIRRMGWNAKKRVYEICHPKKIIPKYVRVYENLCLL